jgi:hypothetical protein
MMEIRKALDELPAIVKIILVIFFDAVYGALYRLAPLTVKAVVVALIWFFTGGFIIGWILDILAVVKEGKPTFLVD